MSRLDDYQSRMTTSQFTDEDFELLLRGEDLYPELASLVPFVNALREQVEFEPDRDDVDRAAMRAAAVVHSQLAATRPATILTLRTPSPWRRLSERTTLVLGSVLAVAAMSGVGLAADAASPGDFLYPIDVVLEKIGIGDGATTERLAEAGVLVERENLSGAVELLADSISQADPDGDAAAVGAAIEALEELLSDIDEGPGVARDASEKVSELLDFIDANAGKGNGLDGKQFGQGVAEIARGGSGDGDDPGTEPTTDSGAKGNSENSNAGGSGKGSGNDGSGEPPGNSDGSGNSGTSTEAPENSGASNAGGNGNGGNGSGEPAGNSGNSNAGGNGNGNGKP